MVLDSGFSIGDMVLDQYQSDLKPDNIATLICTQDGYLARKFSIYLIISPLLVYFALPLTILYSNTLHRKYINLNNQQ